MKLPCAVTRDLLPLYAENMVEPDTKALIEQHLTECPACQERLAEIEAPAETPVETLEPLQSLKKEIRRRRWATAVIAALCVFIGVFTYFYHVTSPRYVPWADGMIIVRPEINAALEEDGADDASAPESDHADDATAAIPGADENAPNALVLYVSGFINGFEEHTVVDDDGTRTVLLQCVSINQSFDHLNQVEPYNEYTISPVPDRLIYGFEDQQKLLWGKPLDGGIVVLPRLALGYYVLIAAGLTGLIGLLWGIFRNWKYAWILRQCFFAPVSYLLSHLLLKGTATTSFFLQRDFFSILLIALAIYTLLTLGWQLLQARGKGT